MFTITQIGKRCREFRIKNKFSQTDIAKETGYSQNNISAFERGVNDNGLILMWYIEHGMSLSDFFEPKIENNEV